MTISVYIPENIVRKLDEVCIKERRTRSGMLTLLVERGLETLEGGGDHGKNKGD